MKFKRWREVESIYRAALERAPAQRKSFLTEACAGDRQLLDEVESLLGYEREAGEFLESPALQLEAQSMAREHLEDRIRGFQSSERFQIQKELGEGGFGVVYEVYDRKREAVVALKMLRQVDSTQIYRFKKEFRILSDLAHANLIALHELLLEHDQWFFTMELIEGCNLLQYLRPGFLSNASLSEQTTASVLTSAQNQAPSSRFEPSGARVQASREMRIETVLSLDRLRESFAQLAEGVCALHDAKVLHRDLKPSNVLVTNEGRVVILDFGLVTELSPQQMRTGTHSIVGTPAYMAPEQATGEHVSEAADWYSVGVMLYQALTGRLPFEGTVPEVFAKKFAGDPPPPSTLSPGIPADLDELCRDLLRASPAERPRRRDVVTRLARPERRRYGSSTDPASVRDTFVGRRPQMEALWSAFQRVKAGHGHTVRISGKSGMGKTTLVRRFLRDLQKKEPKTVVLTGRCYERDFVPYKALDSVVDALSDFLKRQPPLEAERIMPRDVLALARLFSSTPGGGSGTADAPPDTGDSRRSRIAPARICCLARAVCPVGGRETHCRFHR